MSWVEQVLKELLKERSSSPVLLTSLEEEQRILGKMNILLWFKLTRWQRLDMAIDCKYFLSRFLFQFLSCVLLFTIIWTAARQASLSITNSRSLHKLMSIESVMSSNHLILCLPLLLLPLIFPSIRIFSSGSALHIQWPRESGVPNLQELAI